MVNCPHPKCSDTDEIFETERGMKIHHKLAHGESIAKEDTRCEECKCEFDYYPSSKEGKFCEDCVRESDTSHGPDRNTPSEIFDDNGQTPDEYYSDRQNRTGSEMSNVGDVSEKVFEAEMTKRDIKISKPTTYMCEYDYIVDINGQLYRVQVKTGREKRGTIVFETARRTVNRKSVKSREYENVDVFIVRNKHNDDLYWIAEDTIGSNQNMRLRFKEPMEKHSNISWAKDYELDKKIESLK